MARVVSIGKQDFGEMREGGYFLVDKTAFIRDWWRAGDDATLVCRPRRFGKTLTLSMVECFFSNAYAGRGEELFGGLDVWDGSELCALQGTMPVVYLSFASIKQRDCSAAFAQIRQILRVAVGTHDYLRHSDALNDGDRAFLARVSDAMDDIAATTCLRELCRMLHAHWGVKPLVLIDEYDTPMQEAWVGGYWDEMADFMRQMFNATLKTNPSLGRALVTGITRVTQESIFSDLNNLRVVTATSDAYARSFGFTEEEVFAAMGEFGLDARGEVRRWYDGFSFGSAHHIYNPWSVTNYLNERELRPYWANTSGNALVASLVREGDDGLKADFEVLLAGGSIRKDIDELVAFQDLSEDPDAVWSLLLASGYVRADGVELRDGLVSCELALTNHEVAITFDRMVRRWFQPVRRPYGEFVRALLAGDARAMTRFLGDVAVGTFSNFDSGTHPSEEGEPERFWHGFVLGLLVELRQTHQVLSNRESGYGRYDTMIVPRDTALPATVLEFKVVDAYDGERTLGDAVASALRQIEERDYDAELRDRGFVPEQIRHFGVAFQGKRVLVG